MPPFPDEPSCLPFGVSVRLMSPAGATGLVRQDGALAEFEQHAFQKTKSFGPFRKISKHLCHGPTKKVDKSN